MPTTPQGVAAPRNLVLATFHPGALRPYIVNWVDVASHLVARIHREIAASTSEAAMRA